MRRRILRSLLVVDRRSQGKKELQAWKFGIKLVQELRIARYLWNIVLPQRVGVTPTRPHRLQTYAKVRPGDMLSLSCSYQIFPIILIKGHRKCRGCRLRSIAVSVLIEERPLHEKHVPHSAQTPHMRLINSARCIAPLKVAMRNQTYPPKVLTMTL